VNCLRLKNSIAATAIDGASVPGPDDNQSPL
jgi:hypothetical protein